LPREHFPYCICAPAGTIVSHYAYTLIPGHHGTYLSEADFPHISQGKGSGVYEIWEHRMHDKRLKSTGHQPDRDLSPDAAPADSSRTDVSAAGITTTAQTLFMAMSSPAACRTASPSFIQFHSRATSPQTLHFCEPSENDEPNAPPPLRSHAIMSKNLLEYQSWIRTLFSDTDKMECRGLEHCELINGQLLSRLRDEWTSCTRGRDAMALSRLAPFPPSIPLGPVQIVDTRSFPFWVPC
jgi:hypothetical protein